MNFTLEDLVISDYYFNLILTELGYPLILDSDLEISKADIIKYCIAPAVVEYYNFFPIKNRQEYSVSSNFSIDFFDDNTFAVLSSRFNPYTPSSSGYTGNPFVDSYNLQNASSSRRGVYGTRYNYGMNEVSHTQRVSRQSDMSIYSSFKIYPDYVNRKVTGFSNREGKLLIEWGSMSNAFEDVKIISRKEVIDLAKAKTLRMIGMLRGQQNSNTAIEFNFDMFINRADELEDKVYEKWRAKTKPVMIRE